MKSFLEIFFLPPMAVARVGAADEPIESFCWSEDKDAHGQTTTIIVPSVSLRVKQDAAVEPYLPDEIHFKDDQGRIRPTAPFFELWALVQDEDGAIHERPITLALLAELGMSPASVKYRITAGNRKAARRTGTATCAFIGRVEMHAGDHASREILAWSPHSSGQTPLVTPDHPIPLGWIQALKPVEREVDVFGHRVDLGTLRIRFTPPRGRVFGPPTATTGPANPLPPGSYYPAMSEYGRIHEIVPPENRFLSPNTVWSTEYVMMNGLWEDPTPEDGYEGANVGNWQAWGVVDDTSDATIEAFIACGGKRFTALARVMTGPPDFAPDRRPFYSIADDLADRELEPHTRITRDNCKRIFGDIVSLFRRAFETVSLLNLDAARTRALQENEARAAGALHLKGIGNVLVASPPKISPASMTAEDTPYVDRVQFLTMPQPPDVFSVTADTDRLPYTQAAGFVHAQLMDDVVLLDFLRRRREHVLHLLRPPFGAFVQFPETAGNDPDPRFRDPRVLRDSMNDMRMPPYMRDACFFPLSLTRRAYLELVAFLEFLGEASDETLREWLHGLAASPLAEEVQP